MHQIASPTIMAAQSNYVLPRRDGRKLEVQIDGARSTCLAGDITVVLDSLGLERCAWFARASASQSFYDMATGLPERITHGVVVNGLVPRRYIARKSVTSKWTSALISASFVSYPVARMILGAGERLIRKTDTTAFLQKMYGHSASDREALADHDVAASILAGVQHVVAQGLDAGVEDIVSGISAWTPPFDRLRAPVTLYHRREDPNVPFDGVAELARGHCAHPTLLPEDAGGQLWYSHFNRILDLAVA